ncbi:hypothetical protein D3C85_706570 [compost metagenome]|jgi:hypothetical protein
MTDTRPTLKPELQALEDAYAAFKEANERLDQKIQQCLHAGGPWPTEADYKDWKDAADALRKTGLSPSEEAAGNYVG